MPNSPITEVLIEHSGALHYLRTPAGELTWISSNSSHYLGATPDQIIGSSLPSLLVESPTNSERWLELQAAHESDDESEAQIELEIQGQRANPLWIEIRESKIADTRLAPSDQIVGVAFNINDRKFRESHVQQAQRLENLGLLAAGIAHDLNNILAPIIIAGSIMRPLAQDARHLRMIEILQVSAERGSRIVRQILGFSRSNEGERGPVDPRHILREVLLVVQETFPRNIEIHDNIPHDLDQISANPTQIHQLLLNLCINARDAMPDGGILTISGENCRRTSPPPQFTGSYSCRDWLKLVVKDNGTGIPSEALEQIWIPFYTTKLRGEGTGLGLSTVRGLVTSHGGFSTVESTVGKGTQFEIWLPTIDQISPSTEPEPSTPKRPGRGERILVVDDEPSLRDMISDILSSKGYDVIVASDGVDALASVNVIGQDLALVITDVHMPHMSGDVLVSVLKRIYPNIPVLAISGHPNADKNWEGESQAQPDASLVKPFTGPRLIQQVCKLIPPQLNEFDPATP